jgi:hypothetical protein
VPVDSPLFVSCTHGGAKKYQYIEAPKVYLDCRPFMLPRGEGGAKKEHYIEAPKVHF